MKHDWDDLQQQLRQVEAELAAVKTRLATVMAGEQEQEELEQRLTSLSPQLKAEIKEITDRIAAIEIEIESRLFNWGALKEVFWLVVRFTGLGIVIGVMLQRCAGC
ncbi:MAG: hypothetical protein RMK91_01640 [Pseudanabaenaceae cyanobacterium SKYGB_i_bin29]|nr:hypothetical protein [Pseudanabaenaceae cyanobacterium SKYG29]MDW8420551.1 hypothetical protein [Pseudanabaenaceae cyanobacterium SKYGB_i_bin29]